MLSLASRMYPMGDGRVTILIGLPSMAGRLWASACPSPRILRLNYKSNASLAHQLGLLSVQTLKASYQYYTKLMVMATNLAGLDLAHVPAQAPPPGVIPNFVNPESQGYILIIVIAISFSLMFPVVALRVYLRNWVNRSFGWDDGEPSDRTRRLC